MLQLLLGIDPKDFYAWTELVTVYFQQDKTGADCLAAVECKKSQFGKRFIVLPNVMYGDWESAIYDYNFKLTDEEKAARRKSQLKSY